MRFKVAVTLSLLLLASVCLAQEITGTIVGTVKDPHGAVVPNATVTVTNTDQNVVVRTVKTDSDGAYVAPLLPIGHYSVTVTADGFKKISQTNINLNVGDKLTHNFALQVGGAEQEVTVEANPLQVELQSATTSTVVSGAQIRELTLNNRNYQQLITLMPGVSSTQPDSFYIGTTNPQTGGVNVIGMSVNGLRTSANNYLVDGADNVDRGSNLTLLTTPSVDAISEFRVIRSNYNAEYGRAGASQINVITRSGTNAFHGSAYEFWRNENLNADDYFIKQQRWLNPAGAGCDKVRFASDPGACDSRKPLRYHDFGYTFGGPLYIPGVYNEHKDKTFFFFSQEFRRDIRYSTQTAIMPTAAELQGHFTQPVCVNFAVTGTTISCAAGGTATTVPINPASAAFIKDIFGKVPLAASDTNRNVLNSFRNVSNFRQELLRVDQIVSPTLAFYGRLENDTVPTIEPLGLFGPNTLLPGVGTTTTNSPGRTIVIRGTKTFSPTTLLEVGYNYSYGAILSDPTGLMNPANSPDVNVKTPFASTLNRIPSLGFFSLSGTGTFGQYRDYNRNHQALANLSKVVGKHSLKFGATYYHYQKHENAAGNNAGTLNFGNTGAVIPTGASTALTLNIRQQQTIANFLQGNIDSFTQASIDIDTDVRANQWEFYGQDEWRATKKLTVSAGLRWSMFRQPTGGDFLTNFDPRFYDPAQAPQLDAAGNLVPGTGNLLNGVVPSTQALATCQSLLQSGQVPLCWPSGTKALYGDKAGNEDNHAFAPRIGLAYDPFGDGKTSIRAGYGIFYDAGLFAVVQQNIFGNTPFVNSLTVNPVTGTPFVTFGNIAGALSLPKAPPSIGSRVDPNFTAPYIQNWNLSVQRELPGGFLIDTSYVGNKGTHLIGSVDINSAPPGAYIAAGIASGGPITSAAQALQINRVRPFQGWGAIPAIRSWFNSNYNSLQTSLQKRFKNSSEVSIAYTWSHALTNNQTDRSTASRNLYDLNADYGPTQQDRRHIFSGNFIYMVPFFKEQHGVLGKTLGGWELSGITSVGSGVPFTVTDNTNTRDNTGLGCFRVGASPCSVFPDVNVDALYTGQAKNPDTATWRWFNNAAFSSVPAGQLRTGNARRGQVYGPGFWRQDMSISKNMKFSERFSGTLRADAFNVFNHTNPLTVSTSMVSSLFGTVTAVRDPRQLQLGFKLNF